MLHCLYKLMIFLTQHRISNPVFDLLEWSESSSVFLPNASWEEVDCIKENPECIYLLVSYSSELHFLWKC